MFELHYDVFLILPFAKFDVNDVEKEQSVEENAMKIKEN